MITDPNTTPGNTPLHPDDAAGMIPNLAVRRELDQWERQNILKAQKWAFSSRVMRNRDPLDEIYLRELHRKMFDQTWNWAGKYRVYAVPKTIVNEGAYIEGSLPEEFFLDEILKTLGPPAPVT